LASSQTEIASLSDRAVEVKQDQQKIDAADEKKPVNSAAVNQIQKVDAAAPTETRVAPPVTPRENTTSETAVQKSAKVDLKPRSNASLNSRATKRVVPTYPPLAKSAGTAGVVRVYVTVDEAGKVIEVSGSDGPVTLRATSEQAAWGWRFVPSAIGGKPLPMKGFIEFIFEL